MAEMATYKTWDNYWKYWTSTKNFLQKQEIDWHHIKSDEMVELGGPLMNINESVRIVHYMQYSWRKGQKEIALLKEKKLGIRTCVDCKKDLPLDMFCVIVRQNKNVCVDCARRNQRERMRYYYYEHPEKFNVKYRRRLEEI